MPRTITVLNVAEKPMVAKEVSAILGKGRADKKKGYSQMNPVHYFPYQLEGNQCKMIFTSVLGHLLARDFSQSVRGWQSCPPSTLFDEPIHTIVPKKMQMIDKTLQGLSRKADWLVLWLDFDREGENICFEVMERCLKVNRNLVVKRAKFSSVIPREIYQACENLIQPDKNKSDAAEARSELDLRVGAAFTRCQTLFLQKKIADLKELVISYGPCQFPTLGFVVDRYWRIEEFEEEPFWRIDVTAKREGGTASFTWERGRLFDYPSSFVIYEMCTEAPQATVLSVTQKKKDKWRPLPLNTVALQKLASKKLRMSSERVVKVAEDLYRAGKISYPRTETDSFPPGTDLRGMVQQHCDHPQWGQYAQGLMNGKFRNPRQGKNNDQSHPPIHPTAMVARLDKPEEAKLYELIVRHFLACCSEDAHGAETIVTIDIAGEKFTTKGLMVLELNYLEVYPYEKWTDKSIPVFKERETFIPTTLLLTESKTAPPELLTEAELIDLMDKHGIGTDATIAQHIGTILTREYASKENNRFTPTTLGLALVDGYKKIGFTLDKPDLRATMEQDLENISQGKMRKVDVTTKYINAYRELYETLEQQIAVLARACETYFAQ